MGRIIIFASGTATGGGSGFEALAVKHRTGEMSARIAGVASDHENGGVRRIAELHGVPFFHFAGPWTAEHYLQLAKSCAADWFVLSGWLKMVRGLDPRRTINVHPAPLPRFGGQGMYGLRAHEAVLAAYRRGELRETELCMHFVTDEYDAGPIFCRLPVPILDEDTPETLAERVKRREHDVQWRMTDLVVNGDIRWDGKDPASLVVPSASRHLLHQ
jgi:phosphoribosylglycinamide formyltransferase 1